MSAKPRRRSSQVPGQFLGYSLQTTRALIRLLNAPPGSFVSVETLDDVAVSGGGNKTLVQTKSAGPRTNPISDRSPELWKTLANWVRGVKNGDIDPARTEFELFVSKKCPGNLARSFDSANSVSEASTALASARDLLNGEGGSKGKKRRAVPVALAPHLALIFGETSIATEIISRMSLTFGSGRSGVDVLAPLRTKVISDHVLEIVANQMLGWVKQTIDGLIEQQKPATVSTDAFNLELGAFVRRVDRFEILNSFAPEPTQEAVDLEIQSRVYVMQLDLIGSDYDTKLAAATDFLRASVNRSVWAAKGLVHRASFTELEERLKRTWRAKRDAVAVQASHHAPESRGVLLYSECSQIDASIDGRPVPSHFGPGCYHAMAETLDVGWHPEYKDRLGATSDGGENGGGS